MYSHHSTTVSNINIEKHRNSYAKLLLPRNKMNSSREVGSTIRSRLFSYACRVYTERARHFIAALVLLLFVLVPCNMFTGATSIMYINMFDESFQRLHFSCYVVPTVVLCFKYSSRYQLIKGSRASRPCGALARKIHFLQILYSALSTPHLTPMLTPLWRTSEFR
jgi:hypothetical protein